MSAVPPQLESKLSIVFGALAPKLHEQVWIRGVKRTRLKGLQECADAITVLKILGFISDGDADRARHRLLGRRVDSGASRSPAHRPLATAFRRRSL